MGIDGRAFSSSALAADTLLTVSAQFAPVLLGWKPSPMKDRKPKNKLEWPWVPNSADVDNATSLRLAAAVLEELGDPNPNLNGKPPSRSPQQSSGVSLERAVADDLGEDLRANDPSRRWVVHRNLSIANFAQYQHLAGVEVAIANDPNLRVTLGTDYLITPDVLVGIEGTPTITPHPWLHAALACKWTIRSDRVQNIRHENGNMIRHRRGRLPHLATVTAEPMPSRLAAIARGTGEVDVTYHIAYRELALAVAREGTPDQQAAWDEVVGQGRLRDYNLVARSLVDW